MKKTGLLLLSCCILLAAQAQNKNKTTFLNLKVGYGTETNTGYYGLFGGAALEKALKKKVVLEGAADYFTGHGDLGYTNASENYQALFLTPKIGYHLIGSNWSFFRLTFVTGPSFKWYHERQLTNEAVHPNPDGTETVTGPVTYATKNSTELSWYSGIDFKFRLSRKVNAGLFFDTHSHSILMEHFMPGVKVGIRL